MVRKQHTATQLYDAAVSPATRRHALTSGEIPVAVYGLGKMGLPLATVLADVTGNVTGVDIDGDVVEAINRGECPVENEPGLDELLERTVEAGAFEATTESVAAAREACVHVVIVPTVLNADKEPDLSALELAIETIGEGLSAGDMVVIESTVPPRTCRDVIQPLLAERSGLSETDFGLAFCPERTASGRALEDIRGAYPKVVGGRDEQSTVAAELFYQTVTSNTVVTVSNCRTAECVKLFEGVYRDVNIALANELAGLGEEFGLDVNEAIDVANGPSYCDIHSPGPGVGGHCIPYYPYFLIDRADRELRLLQEARRINDSMPAYTVCMLEEKLENHGIDLSTARVALLGITYRSGVDETRAAPAFPLASLLSDLGTTVYAADPICTQAPDLAAERVTIDVLPALDLDAVILVTGHEEFRTIGWDEMEDTVVLDGRQFFSPGEIPHPVYWIGNGTAQDAGNNRKQLMSHGENQ